VWKITIWCTLDVFVNTVISVGISLMAAIKRQRRPSSPKGQYTPPVYVTKKLYRAACRAKCNDGRVNDAGTGQWVVRSSNKAQDSAKAGGAFRGGATKGGPVPKFEYYNKKLTGGE
jgi:hypothetical protein